MKHTLKRYKHTLVSLSLLAVVIVVGFTVTQFRKADLVRASSGDNFTGFAWSDMPNGSDEVINPLGLTVGRGAGWISFNSDDIGSGIGYGVNVNALGAITGQAWSEHMGWVSFDSVSGCPGTAPCAPTINLTTGAFSGWARALASSDAQAGGWDGWIALTNNGTGGPAYGVTVNITTGDVSGYAWGGDVMGWINFTGVHIDLQQPTLTITASPSLVSSCGISPVTDLVYNATYNPSTGPSPFNSCTITSTPSTSVNGDTMPGDHPLPVTANQPILGVSVAAPSTTYTLTCTGTGVPTTTATTTATVTACTPTAVLSGTACFQTAPSTGTLVWSSSNVTSCTLNGSPVATNGTQTVTVTGTTTYNLNCTGPNGSTSASHTITVSPTCTNPGGGAGGTITPIFNET